MLESMHFSLLWIWKERKWTADRRRMMKLKVIDQLHTEKNSKKEFHNYLKIKVTKVKMMKKNMPISTSSKPRILAQTFLMQVIIQVKLNLNQPWVFIRHWFHYKSKL